jgi:hypothetical protein
MTLKERTRSGVLPVDGDGVNCERRTSSESGLTNEKQRRPWKSGKAANMERQRRETDTKKRLRVRGQWQHVKQTRNVFAVAVYTSPHRLVRDRETETEKDGFGALFQKSIKNTCSLNTVQRRPTRQLELLPKSVLRTGSRSCTLVAQETNRMRSLFGSPNRTRFKRS